MFTLTTKSTDDIIGAMFGPTLVVSIRGNIYNIVSGKYLYRRPTEKASKYDARVNEGVKSTSGGYKNINVSGSESPKPPPENLSRKYSE